MSSSIMRASPMGGLGLGLGLGLGVGLGLPVLHRTSTGQVRPIQMNKPLWDGVGNKPRS